MQFKTLVTGFLLAGVSCTLAQNSIPMKTLHDFTVTQIDGKEFDLAGLKGKKILIVNTASKCGLTPQYQELESLYEKYKSNNFVILGFPANDFAAQEPGSDKEIADFCSRNYGVSFPMMSKISVKGDNQHPLYSWLTHKALNGKSDYDVKWNFHKFLIDENGNLVKDIEPRASPMSTEIINWIEGK